MAMTQTACQDFGWPDGLGCYTPGTGEGEGSVRACRGGKISRWWQGEGLSLAADDLFMSDGKGFYIDYTLFQLSGDRPVPFI